MRLSPQHGKAEDRMTEGQHRVVVWSTGGIGSIAIRTIQQRPNLELVGVWVHSDEKVGKDAGELANGQPIGLAATNDADTLIALKPDCVVYAAAGPERDALAVPDYLKLLEAGINVVTTSTTHLVNPAAYEPAEWRDQLSTAAKQGQVSLYASGIEPGFAADYLPLVLSTQSASIEKIHCFEIGLYDDYGVPDIMINGLGFGQPLDYQPFVAIPGAIAGEWQGQIRMIGDALGVEIDEVRETFDRQVTNRTLEVAMGTVEAGTCGALRMQAIGIVDGREAIVIEHVTRLAHDVAPDWPTGKGDLSYRVLISGDPDIDCTLEAKLRDPAAAGIDGMTSGSRGDGRHGDACCQRHTPRGCSGARLGEFDRAAPHHSARRLQARLTTGARRQSHLLRSGLGEGKAAVRAGLARPLAGFISVAAAVGIIALAVTLFDDGFAETADITVLSPRAGLVMNPDAKVQFHGVQVGKVRSIEGLNDGRAAIHLAMDPDRLAIIPANVKVDIASATVFGAKSVRLVSPEHPSADSIQAGQVLGADDVMIEVNTVFEQLVRTLSSIQPEKLSETLGAIAAATNDRGEQFGQMLSDFNSTLGQINPSLDALNTDLSVAPQVVRTYADAASDLVSVAKNATRLSQTIVAEQDNLDAALISVIGLADIGTEVLA